MIEQLDLVGIEFIHYHGLVFEDGVEYLIRFLLTIGHAQREIFIFELFIELFKALFTL